MWVGKPQKYNQLSSTKPAKLGVILYVVAYWIRIRPNLVFNRLL